MTINPEWIGSVAAVLTTVAFLPQAVKLIREKDARAISLPMYVIFMIGICLWFVYGYLMGSPAIMTGNGVTIVLSAVIIWTKVKYG